MAAYDKDTGIQPATREALSVQAAAMSGDIAFNVMTANVTPAPTTEAFSYTVAFEVVDSDGRRHEWYNGDAAATIADTSTAGTASIDDATPAVVNGYGTVVVSGDAASWLDTETVTLTLDDTILGVTLASATWTITFTA